MLILLRALTHTLLHKGYCCYSTGTWRFACTAKYFLPKEEIQQCFSLLKAESSVLLAPIYKP